MPKEVPLTEYPLRSRGSSRMQCAAAAVPGSAGRNVRQLQTVCDTRRPARQARPVATPTVHLRTHFIDVNLISNQQYIQDTNELIRRMFLRRNLIKLAH